MASTPISGLTAATAVNTNDVLPLVQSGTTKRATVAQILANVAIPTSTATSINVRDYGAKGDGVTNDTTAVQNAVNAAITAGITVTFPPGTFLLNTITITGDLRLRGNGWKTTLRLANSVNAYLLVAEQPTTGSIRIDMADFTLDGNAANQTAGGCFDLRFGVQSMFDNIHWMNAYDICLWLRNRADGTGYGHHNRVTRCLFDTLNSVSSANQRGIVMQSADENYIAFNDFENWGGASATPGTEPYAIKDWAGLQQIISNVFVGGQEAIRVEDSSNSRLIGNTFDGVGRAGIHITGSRCVVANNHFSDGSGASGQAGAWAQCEIDNSSGCVVNGNMFVVQTTATVRNSLREYSTSSNNTLAVGNLVSKLGSYYGSNTSLQLYGTNSTAVNNIGLA